MTEQEEQTTLEHRFLNAVHDAEGMEEVFWLSELWQGIQEEDWSNVSYRAWVLNQEYDHRGLIHAIDREHGEELRRAKNR